ncbi:hypothetical protein MPTK1_6g20580 [Marchantia polymorpha subsp. ruderalis]|uniref:Uncharacterized protein n=2 Tax=Marchantia polymorpha TaxID=3197 RepID=A0AAF6BU82_MARPO|nr:hypothetical protein MARPO_0045s0006 [Marchantia polymorpha]BBN15566.1 hypothetical protein Mp_6g20580 [Marchantia polymorpha subsp. ruderalis]|eukprot:PTQ39323.1 hypothetical protein MARPO_0045s0006 [Marchantia polymorpha]
MSTHSINPHSSSFFLHDICSRASSPDFLPLVWTFEQSVVDAYGGGKTCNFCVDVSFRASISSLGREVLHIQALVSVNGEYTVRCRKEFDPGHNCNCSGLSGLDALHRIGN